MTAVPSREIPSAWDCGLARLPASLDELHDARREAVRRAERAVCIDAVHWAVGVKGPGSTVPKSMWAQSLQRSAEALDRLERARKGEVVVVQVTDVECPRCDTIIGSSCRSEQRDCDPHPERIALAGVVSVADPEIRHVADFPAPVSERRAPRWNIEPRLDGLTEAQRDGLACVYCGRQGDAMVPVGEIDGVQVFAHAEMSATCPRHPSEGAVR